MARGRTERADSKVKTAGALAGLGAGIGAVGGPLGSAIGGGIGALTGLIIGDSTTVFPMDMIAIPAYQAYLIETPPAFSIYIKEGEVLTQVVPTDAQVAAEELGDSDSPASKPKRPPSAYHRRFKRVFKSIEKDYKKKDGSWKKDGFKKAVKEAHRLTKSTTAAMKRQRHS